MPAPPRSRRARRLAALALAAFGLAACAREPAPAPAAAAVHEASTNLDVADLPAVLARVAGRAEGLAPDAVATVAREGAALEPGAEREWTFTVRHAGAETPLRLRLRREDATELVLTCLSGTRELAAALHEELVAYAEAKAP